MHWLRPKFMSNRIKFLLLALLLALATAAQTPQSIPNGLPAWAYNIPDKVQPPSLRRLARSICREAPKSMTPKIASNANPPDWFPDEHGPAPRIVTGEGGVTMMACGACHLMSGQGHPESADIAGLPADYIVRQMSYFKSGARKDDDRMGPIAKATSDEDMRQAAEYFAAIKPILWVKVIETGRPPKTYVSAGARHRLLSPDGGTEPIGHRIIEIPERPVSNNESRSTLPLYRLCSARKHRRGRGVGEDRRLRQDDRVCYLSRRPTKGSR